ncbi:sulfite exporter TauE/SafE family protein [Sinorhizobium sp. RAC02]|uniref:sulfite exporter TauE/SafE family protein n=1 Tax=Sinorhizobium sp. RAC02 TaxID=1842534 RepID=UPI00083CAE28|nr:sulfite exporter TauE/SafE family protein [Sinorhizobium sp. RAC02]
MDQNDVVIIIATFLLAGIVKGVTGMGLPTVAMGVLGAVLSPLTAATLLLVPSFVTNVWQLLTGPRFKPLLWRLWPMMGAVIAGTLVGSTLLADGASARTTVALGLTLVAYAAYTLCAAPRRVPSFWQPVATPLVGLVTGLVTGATGVFVIPAVPYLQALDLEKDELVQALGLSFTVSTIALALALGFHGALPAENLVPSLLAVVPALIGMAVGQAIRQRISPSAFRRGFLVCLLLLGCEMALRPLFVG